MTLWPLQGRWQKRVPVCRIQTLPQIRGFHLLGKMLFPVCAQTTNLRRLTEHGRATSGAQPCGRLPGAVARKRDQAYSDTSSMPQTRCRLCGGSRQNTVQRSNQNIALESKSSRLFARRSGLIFKCYARWACIVIVVSGRCERSGPIVAAKRSPSSSTSRTRTVCSGRVA